MKRLLLCTAVLIASLACGQEPLPAPPKVTTGLDLTSRFQDPPTAQRAPYEELLADLAAVRHPKDGAGRAWIEAGPLEIQARGRGRWSLIFEAGPLGIDVDGLVFLMSSPFWGWSQVQSQSPAMAGYTTVELVAEAAADDPLALEIDTLGGQLLAVHVTGRALAPGEQLRFVYGAGPGMAVADQYAERESHFWFAVDGDGDGVRAIVVDSPSVRVLAGPPAQLQLFLPGTARPGDTVRVTAALLDAAGSAGVEFAGELLLASDERWPGMPQRVALPAEADGRVHFDFTLPSDAPEGILRFGAVAVTGETTEASPRQPLGALSNPMRISRDAPRILWADLHGHSNLSDGTGTPEDYYTYARDVAALDVAALTDHDHWGVRFLDARPELWQRIQAATLAANAPRSFTSLLAFEWTNWIHGHRHVVYFEDEGPMISSIDPATDDPAELWDTLRDLPALTFAHHSAGAPVPTNWSFAPDPELEPITEVASVHGTSEAYDAPLRIRGAWKGNFVRDVLDAGAQLGFIGSGDSHDGHPGLAQLASGTGGLAALFAEENTRGAVRASLQQRACYATSGPRMLLFAELGDAPIGAELAAADLTPTTTLSVGLFGTAPLTRLEVIRSGQVVKVLDALDMEQDAEAPPDFEATFPLAMLGLGDLAAGEYVYLRAVQAGPGVAWSSPWFVR